MSEYILTRSGQAPLKFTGKLLAESDGERFRDQERSRWHELALYLTDTGQYVGRISYHTRWRGEPEWDFVHRLDTPAELTAFFAGHDPIRYVCGYPAGDGYAERQARLLASIKAIYTAQVSEILGSAEEFAEVLS